MKIHLNESEIQAGIKMYIEDQGFSLKGQEVNIDMNQGRNPQRIFADIEIKKIKPKAEQELEVAGVMSSAVTDVENNNSETKLFGEES